MSDWLPTPLRWPPQEKALLLQPNPLSPRFVSLEEVIEKSSNFSRKIPIETPTCHFLQQKVHKTTLEDNINSVYPVIHEFALLLCAKFLNHQKGGPRKDIYASLTIPDFIDRLLSKRAILFMGPDDRYVLRNNKLGCGGWEKIGTNQETGNLLLKDYLSYDEIKLSALLNVSSHTFFLNDGNRQNRGKFEEDRSEIQENGVIMGQIGTRLEKEDVMEYCEIIKSKKRNFCTIGGTQRIFSEFYGDTFQTFDELQPEMEKSDRYIPIRKNDTYFDKLMYERRLILSFDALLIEGNARAKSSSKRGFIHVVGLGLGVWKLHPQQNQLFLDTFLKRIEFLVENLQEISDIRFAYLSSNSKINKIRHINLHFENTEPQVKLQDPEKLLIVSYAWDGNAHPGNEFWIGSLAGSGDPAAACSTQVAELHNWYINPKLKGNTVKIATSNGLIDFLDYQQLHKND